MRLKRSKTLRRQKVGKRGDGGGLRGGIFGGIIWSF